MTFPQPRCIVPNAWCSTLPSGYYLQRAVGYLPSLQDVPCPYCRALPQQFPLVIVLFLPWLTLCTWLKIPTQLCLVYNARTVGCSGNVTLIYNLGYAAPKPCYWLGSSSYCSNLVRLLIASLAVLTVTAAPLLSPLSPALPGWLIYRTYLPYDSGRGSQLVRLPRPLTQQRWLTLWLS